MRFQHRATIIVFSLVIILLEIIEAKSNRLIQLQANSYINHLDFIKLKSLGVEYLERIREDETYLCKYNNDDLEPLKSSPLVKNVKFHNNELVYGPIIRQRLESEHPGVIVPVAIWAFDNFRDRKYSESVRVNGLIKEMLGRETNFRMGEGIKIDLTLDEVRRVAGIDGIRQIEQDDQIAPVPFVGILSK
ncbi:hypothetical protein AKO1_013519 [Acrasis kona]|uniref:Uncharacterized protein n=1 Tax=Acrasis kona TaxID=1008807 RepID=A0AAW2ZHS9_9EUKA